MKDLKGYVEELFRHQHLTPEVKDLKEEILSNMIAKRDDLIAQGIDADFATEKAKESLSTVDCLIDGNQLTDISKYRLECTQTVLLNCIIFWIFSLPLLFTHYAIFSNLGILLTICFGILYLWQRKQPSDIVAFLSTKASELRKKTVWFVWGLFFAVCVGIIAVLTFGSDIWFGMPLNISGPYEMANIAARIYLPLLTIIIPITFSNFTKLLMKNRKRYENE
ncbi:MAG: hypothetical protein J1E85_02715 [Ruminococcus sp.]|nr:hypothetical protein [Ruminococcus sp.]